jgi:hypothetical protein
VGIGVMSRGGELYAVEDFDRSFSKLTLDEQEGQVGALLREASAIEILPPTSDARRTCAMESGYAGGQMPWFIMRYTAADLGKLPETLRTKVASGRFRHAEVGACAAAGTNNFSAYSIAVMLYP